MTFKVYRSENNDIAEVNTLEDLRRLYKENGNRPLNIDFIDNTIEIYDGEK